MEIVSEIVPEIVPKTVNEICQQNCSLSIKLQGGKDQKMNSYTVRPRDTRPQAARTLTMHVFPFPKKRASQGFLDPIQKCALSRSVQLEAVYLEALLYQNTHHRSSNQVSCNHFLPP